MDKVFIKLLKICRNQLKSVREVIEPCIESFFYYRMILSILFLYLSMCLFISLSVIFNLFIHPPSIYISFYLRFIRNFNLSMCTSLTIFLIHQLSINFFSFAQTIFFYFIIYPLIFLSFYHKKYLFPFFNMYFIE